jgi:hypothetical protein
MTDPTTPPGSGQPGNSGQTGKWSFEVVSRTSAPVDRVWPLLAEAERWKEWSFLDRSDLERPGDPAPDGVGAVRRFTRFGIGSREEVVLWDPPRHLGYIILQGFPVRRYRADITLTPDGSGTVIDWRASFDTLLPGSGHLMVAVLKTVIGRFARGAARYAETLRDAPS